MLAVLVTGPPTAGKTTLGRPLARRLSAAVLDLDTATAPLVAVVADLLGVDDIAGPRLAGATRSARYETLTALAEDNLRTGRPVVLVAPFSSERSDVQAWRRLENRLAIAGGHAVLLWLRVEPAVAIERLRARGAPRDHPKLADIDAYASRLDVAEPQVPHVAVDATGAVDDVLEDALASLFRAT